MTDKEELIKKLGEVVKYFELKGIPYKALKDGEVVVVD